MINSLRFYSVLIFILCLILVAILAWTTAVCLEQMWPCLADASRFDTACHDNLASADNLIRLAMGIIAAMGLFIPWMIFRRIIHPLLSMENTLRRVNHGDGNARITIRAGKELNTLAAGINQMLQTHQQEQEQWQNIYQTQAAVSAVRRMMLLETNENGMIQACCNIFVDSGRYRMAQIHLVGETPDAPMNVATQAINQNENFKFVSHPTIKSTFHPTIRAMRNQHIAMIANVFEDSTHAPFQADAERIGYASIIAVPISATRQPIGALTLFVEKPGSFSVEIVQLLTELADDLGHQIQDIRFSSLTKKP